MSTVQEQAMVDISGLDPAFQEEIQIKLRQAKANEGTRRRPDKNDLVGNLMMAVTAHQQAVYLDEQEP